MSKKWIVVLLLSMTIIILGIIIANDRNYLLMGVLLAIVATSALFIKAEKSEVSVTRLVLLALFTALSVVGRIVFTAFPGFKPVAAIVMISGMYFGPAAGYLCGALSALLSNFYFGQGPWTPVQMFAWGIIGLYAGMRAKQLKSSRGRLLIMGAIAGVVYSLILDIWQVMSLDQSFSFSRYVAVVGTSLPFLITYSVSNVVFLWILEKSLGKKIERILLKYDV